MDHGNGRSGVDPTLFRLVLFVTVIFGLFAVFDLARGRGGAAWLSNATNIASASVVTGDDAGATLFRGVRLFDGERVHDRTDVLVEGGLIAAIGSDLAAPDGAEVIGGSGMTLMPGLIDAHTHTFGPVLETSLMLGVTASLDMFTEPASAASMRAQQANDGAPGRTDLFSAGVLVTAPGGHGTQFGMPIPTLTSPAEADAFVQARVDEGSDYIKLVMEPGFANRMLPTLDLPTASAVVAAAHARDRLAVVHVSTYDDAYGIVEAGADGLVHVFWDRTADADFVELMRRTGAFVVPTLTVIESVSGSGSGPTLLEDERLARYLDTSSRTSLVTTFPNSAERAGLFANALESVRALHAAGIPVLAGTDAPNPGTAHGISMHRELELLVEAGMTPIEALSAATAATAEAFGLDDRGRVTVGRRADLVLVSGDPTQDVGATRALQGVWKLGVRADRDAYRDAVAGAAEPASRPQTGATGGLVSDFEAGEITSNFGMGWDISTDAMMGGTSTATMNVVPGGAAGSSHALEVNGEVIAGAQFAWAGPMFYTAAAGTTPFSPADLSAYSGVSFAARGDISNIVVMLFATNRGQLPAVVPVSLSAEWQSYDLDFADFGDLDPAGLQALLFSAAGPGEFSIQIDDVRFR